MRKTYAMLASKFFPMVFIHLGLFHMHLGKTLEWTLCSGYQELKMERILPLWSTLKIGAFHSLQRERHASHVATLFCREILCLHRVPKSVISDHGIKVISYFWKILCAKLGIKLLFSSAYIHKRRWSIARCLPSFTCSSRGIFKS